MYSLTTLKRNVPVYIFVSHNLYTCRPLREVYHLWNLAGGDLQGELKKRGLIKVKSPVLTLPQ